MLSNAYFLANFRFDTAENEPGKNLQLLSTSEKCCKILQAAVIRAEQVTEDTQDDQAAYDTAMRGFIATRRPICKFRQIVARSRLYRHRFLQENTPFAAFFKIYQIIKLIFFEIWQHFANFATFAKCY